MGAPGCGSGAGQGEQGPRELVLDSFLPFSKEVGEFWLLPCRGGPWGGLAGDALHPPTALVGLFWCGQHSSAPAQEKQESWKWVWNAEGGSVGWGRHNPSLWWGRFSLMSIPLSHRGLSPVEGAA